MKTIEEILTENGLENREYSVMKFLIRGFSLENTAGLYRMSLKEVEEVSEKALSKLNMSLYSLMCIYIKILEKRIYKNEHKKEE